MRQELDDARFTPPPYLVRATEQYASCGKNHAAATIALATAAAEYCREVGAGAHGPLPMGIRPERVVRKTLIKLTGDASLASRFQDIDKLAARLEKGAVKLDAVNFASQGALFALLAAAKRVEDEGLQELVEDAALLTIRDFRTKWNTRCASTDEESKRPRLSAASVIAWVATADLADVERVRDAADTRLGAAVSATT